MTATRSTLFLATALLAATPAVAAGVGAAESGAGAQPSGVGFLTGNNINVQTNVDSSKNISVTKTFNGTDVSYGLAGANVLNLIGQAGTYAQGVSSQRAAAAQQAANTAAYAAQMATALGY